MKRTYTFLVTALATLTLTACSQKTTPSPSASVPEETMVQNQMVDDNANGENTEIAATEATEFTLEQVSMHATAEDCWLAINGEVYDVTGFIASGNHGGGDAIIEGCGKDATTLFETRPMGSNTPHSEKARTFLPNFQIGTLVTQENVAE